MTQVKILLEPTKMVLSAEMTGIDLFKLVELLKREYKPKVSWFDQELGDWTCWQPTEVVPLEPVKSKRKKKNA